MEKAKLALKKGGNGLTACHEASTQGDSETVKVLLKHGAKPRYRDKLCIRQVDRATNHHQYKIVDTLD